MASVMTPKQTTVLYKERLTVIFLQLLCRTFLTFFKVKWCTMGWKKILIIHIHIFMHLYFHETFSRNFSWKYRCCFRNYVNQLCSGGVGMKQCVKKMERLSSCPNLYIPSTINIWKKVLTKAIWADKKWAGFWQISLYIKYKWNIKQNRNLDFNPGFSS